MLLLNMELTLHKHTAEGFIQTKCENREVYDLLNISRGRGLADDCTKTTLFTEFGEIGSFLWKNISWFSL